jgi:hypothetical protein
MDSPQWLCDYVITLRQIFQAAYDGGIFGGTPLKGERKSSSACASD